MSRCGAIAPNRTRRALRFDNRGVTAVEFALALPIILLLILGTIEIGMDMLIDSSMEIAVQKASRVGLTTSVPSGKTRDQTIHDIVLGVLGRWVSDPAMVTIVTKSYKSFDNVGKPEPFQDLNGNQRYDIGEPFTDVNGNGVWDADQGAASAGGLGDIVTYHVSFQRPTFTGIFGLIGIKTLSFDRTIVVQNEP